MTAPEPIVDSHHHLWDTVNNNYPWLAPPQPGAPVGVMGDLTDLPRPWLIDDYLSHVERNGIVKSVHVEALWGDDPVDETRWVQAVADRHGFPHGIVSRVELRDPAVGETLDRHLESPNVRGVRECVNWDEEDPGKRFCDTGELMLNPDWRRGFAELASRELVFDLFCNSTQLLPEAVELARSFPETRIVVEHTGAPFDRSEEGLRAWRKGIAAMAAEENVVLKLSGMGMSDHDWTVDSIRPFVIGGIEAFGPSRCMFATNTPADLLYGSFEEIVDAFRELVSELSPAERTSICSGTATEVYRI